MATIQQRKVDPDVQGRVFALSNMIGISMTPLAYITAGIVSDKVFEPLLRAHGALTSSIGQVIGTGGGRGVALFFIIVGLLLAILTIGGYLYPSLRKLEDELPDVSDQESQAEQEKEEVELEIHLAD